MASVSVSHWLLASLPLEHEREKSTEAKLAVVVLASIAPAVSVLVPIIVARVRVIVVSMTVLGMTL